jgi:probable phosphoglycerate mutase
VAGLGERAEIDHGLVEWNYGDYEGLTPKEIHAKVPGWMLFRDGCPSGEGPEDSGRRVDSVIERVRAVERDGSLLTVTSSGSSWLGGSAFQPRQGVTSFSIPPR